MTNIHLNFLCKLIESPIHQSTKKWNLLKNRLISLFEILFFHARWETFDKSILFFNVKFFANVDALLNVVGDAPLKLIRKTVLIAQLLKSFVVFPLFEVLRPNVADEGSDPINVVSETHHRKYLNENEAKSFAVIGGWKVSEADSQHDVDAPVIGPNVLRKPAFARESFDLLPVVHGVEVGHRRQEDREDVGEAEVEEHDFDEWPVLFVVVVLNEADLEFIKPIQALRQFCYYEESDKEKSTPVLIQWNCQNNNIHQIYYHSLFKIIIDNIS